MSHKRGQGSIKRLDEKRAMRVVGKGKVKGLADRDKGSYGNVIGEGSDRK